MTPTRWPSADQQLVQPRGRQLLLAAGPLRRFGQQRLHPRAAPPPRPAAAAALVSFRTGHRLLEILPDRQPRNPELFRDLPLRAALHQHLVTNDMYLVHLEHPFQRTPEPPLRKPAIRPSGGSLSERRMDHFLSGAPTEHETLYRDSGRPRLRIADVVGSGQLAQFSDTTRFVLEGNARGTD